MNKLAKRLFDQIFSLIFLILLSPIFVFVSALILWKLGRPILYRQLRPGFLGRPFWLLKFRTMRDAKDQFGNDLSDKDRLTYLGKFLRSTSLDELPGLVNVVKGEMSFVGPRPLLMEYLPLYDDWQMKRHNVRPGITGWAQVNGRNAISWEDKFKLDIWYVENWSIFLDFKILLLTAYKVLKREGISKEGHVTTEKFKGTKK